MIHTRLSIFKAVRSLIKEMTRHGQLSPDGFKTVMYAVILADMREWAQYVPDYENKEKIDRILEDYILRHKEFPIERIKDGLDMYRNTNTPQDNTTWNNVATNKDFKLITKVTKL